MAPFYIETERLASPPLLLLLLLCLYPPGVLHGIHWSSFPRSGAPEWDHFMYSAKADHSIRGNHRLAVSFNYRVAPRLILDAGGLWDPNDREGGPLAKARRRDDSGTMARLAHDWTVSPRLLNHLNISFNHRGNPQLGVMNEVDGAKELGIRNLSTKGYPAVNWGDGPFVPLERPGFISDAYRADLSWGVLETVTFPTGRHYLKAGFDHRRNHQNNRGSANTTFNFSALATAIPGETFSGNYTGYSFASYLLGIVDSGTQTDLVPLGGRRHYYALFLQDDFKVNSRLTLNLGLRWELQLPAFEAANRLSSWNLRRIDPESGLPGAYDFAGDCSGCTGRRYFGTKSWRGLGPRSGFAWRAPAGFVLRGAYGILYEADSFNGFNPTPLGKPTSVQAGGTYTLASDPATRWQGLFNWDNGFPTDRYQPAGYDVSWGNRNRPGMIDPGYGQTPYIQQWSFNIQRPLVRRMVLDIGYLGNKGTRLKVGELARINQLPPSVLTEFGTRLNAQVNDERQAAAQGIRYPYAGFRGTVASALRAYPQVQGNSTINVYGAPLGFSTHHALQVTVNREMRRGLMVYANYVWAKTISNVDSSLVGDNGSRPLDYYNLKLEKSPAIYDVPHMFKAYVNYDLPFGRGRTFLSGAGRWLNALAGGWSLSAIVNYFSGEPLGFTAPSPLANGWNGAVNRANAAAGPLKASGYSKGAFDLANPRGPQNTYLNKSLFSAPPPLTLGTGARRYGQVRDFGTINEDLGVQKSFHLAEQVRMQLRGEFLNALNRHQLGGINTSVNNASFGQVTSVSGYRQVQVSARIDF